jgi:hypothetical protein
MDSVSSKSILCIAEACLFLRTTCMIRKHSFAQENTGVDKMPLFTCASYVMDNCYYHQSNFYKIYTIFTRFIVFLLDLSWQNATSIEIGIKISSFTMPMSNTAYICD